MTDKEKELEALRARLAASQRLGDGYADRVRAIQARIDEVEKSIV